MAKTLHIVLFTATLSVVAAYHRPDLPPGPYCGLSTNNQCCRDRKDDCSHKILDTLCYCDEFCNRTRAHDDCCPDYEEVCLGIQPDPGFLIQPCEYRNRQYFPGDKRTDNCNTCECVIIDEQKMTTDWKCDSDVCLISDDVVFGVNQPGMTWRASNYSQFFGKKLKDGLIYKLGTFPLSRETKRMGAIRYDKNIPYPRDFDARRRWPNFISPVVDQGWCGSDWAVSIAGVASDRFAIQSNGAEALALSPQTLLSCNIRQQQGCRGGHIDVAWNFARGHGLVDERCFPYKAAVVRCPFKPRGNLIDDGCRPPVKQRTSRYKVGPPGRLSKEEDIMYDIMESGPVQAVMTVYQDFFHYRDGIYRRSRHGDNRMNGLHSVRIIGWGEERGDKYWTVANSWGTEWGENGYFRIARGVDESDIESFVVTVLSDVTEANQKK
ncbi:tubulointerstitial nephritis antigen-like [Pieris rapae]|uniref:tubulointerstitial nephritis antigen-like n=1 Tax=Pieris rapae TaxID=64459 RepID=UPI001E27E891|nr:tubulointerstitial nephritis antigen-like [Pieris rapae]